MKKTEEEPGFSWKAAVKAEMVVMVVLNGFSAKLE